MSNIGTKFPDNAGIQEVLDKLDAKVISSAEQMKDLQKLRLQREVIADPSKAKELVKLEASPVYNSSGKLIQSAGTL